MHYWFGGHVIWMAISWIVGVALLTGLMWLLLLALRERSEPTDSPEAILRRRFASGELDTEEYERRLAELRKTKSAA